MRKIELASLSALKPHPENPKAHDGRLISASLNRFGYAEPIMLDDRTGLMIAGHGRREQLLELREAGKPPPEGVELNAAGEWLVPVIRGWQSKDDVDARAYLLASNEISAKGGWDQGALSKLLVEVSAAGTNVDALLATGFGKSDVDAVLKSLGGPAEPEPEQLLTPPAAAPWVVDGMLYALGAHRLLIGDSLEPLNRRHLIGDKPVDLVLTDPPFAIYGSSSGVGSSIADDKMITPFFEAYWRGVASHLKEFGHSYTFCDWRSFTSLSNTMRRVQGLELKNALTWDKGGSGLGSNYANTTEWIMFAHRVEPKKAMSHRTGVRGVLKPNVLRFNRPHGDERLHNAAKPVDMLRELLKNSSDAGARVWEPFSGSGSTLIACEREGRTCLAGELDPVNAQITIERWQRLTGKKATPVALVASAAELSKQKSNPNKRRTKP